jgi:hypothetical protein
MWSEQFRTCVQNKQLNLVTTAEGGGEGASSSCTYICRSGLELSGIPEEGKYYFAVPIAVQLQWVGRVFQGCDT